MKYVINFSGHKLHPIALKQLAEKLKDDVQVEDIKISLSRRIPLFSQIVTMMKEIKKTPLNSGAPIYVIIPGFAIATPLILAYLHGVNGCFPMAVELIRDPVSKIFVVNDVHDLEYYRQNSRHYR